MREHGIRRKANSSQRKQVAWQENKNKGAKESDRRNSCTHCNTGKLDPAFDDRIVKVFTIVFLSLWLFFEVDIGPARNAHLASIVAFRPFKGRRKGLWRGL
jgi:hypothetical protein